MKVEGGATSELKIPAGRELMWSAYTRIYPTTTFQPYNVGARPAYTFNLRTTNPSIRCLVMTS